MAGASPFPGGLAPLLDYYGYLALAGLTTLEGFGVRRKPDRIEQ